ncbi:hypothetical protein acdb102_33610 [Acidothermaceae bacterium B102]|nr:hypothetical protein acdb102_33610 [Acidothermaceae bacterium B102]
MLLTAGPLRNLGGSPSRLTFGEGPKAVGAWAGRRLLMLDAKPAFELSFWCGTCRFLFQRLDGANETMSMDGPEGQLAEGLDDLDDQVIRNFETLLPRGDYLPLLLTVQPRLTHPAGPDDYFAGEQISTWGVSPFWGLPEYPRTPYYRTFETPVDQGAHLFEFVVPMVPPTWNDASKVAQHAHRLTMSASPTAVAVTTLDVCQPAMSGHSTDDYAHWCLTHFLLDGHHKMEAAADTGRPLRLLSLLSVEASLADAEQVARIPALLTQAAARRT